MNPSKHIQHIHISKPVSLPVLPAVPTLPVTYQVLHVSGIVTPVKQMFCLNKALENIYLTDTRLFLSQNICNSSLFVFKLPLLRCSNPLTSEQRWWGWGMKFQPSEAAFRQLSVHCIILTGGFKTWHVQPLTSTQLLLMTGPLLLWHS